MPEPRSYEVIIIGGSYAGLSAAMSLGRSLRKVLILDSGLTCNRNTPFSHNFITQDGRTPAAIAADARAQVLQYDSVTLEQGLAVSGEKTSDGFCITTDTGRKLLAKKLVFATEVKDLMPPIDGFAACWGISIIHCPYCHGYEFRGQKTGIMANGDKAFHIATLVHNLTQNITTLTNGKQVFTAEQLQKLQGHNIPIMETAITAILQEKGQVREVVFANGDKESFDAIYAAIPFAQHSDIPAQLGCALNEQGYIQTDEFQKTTVAGVYACGDNNTMMRSVANAVYRGNLTGIVVNKALSDEQF